MPLTKDQLSAEYDRLYDEASTIIKRENPCQIERDAAGTVTCVRTRKFPAATYPAGGKGLCCSGCQHLGPDGCTTNSLGCRMGACTDDFEYRAREAGWPEHVIEAMRALQATAKSIGVPMAIRSSKVDAFRRIPPSCV